VTRSTAHVILGLATAALVVATPLAVRRVAGQAARPGAPVAIRGATILTVTRGTIPNGTVLMRDGKIAAVGTDVAIPRDAEVVDATGLYVTPGLIDAHSHIAADSINEGGTTVSSMTGIEDVLDPTDINIYRDLAGGLTTANVLHGSANPIGGKNAVIKLRWGKRKAEELLFEGAPPGIKFALGENPKRPGSGQGRGPRRYPATRPGVEYVIRDAFTRAKAYRDAWREYERRKAAGEDVIPPRRDLQLEPLVEVLEGKRLVHAHSYRADEILMLIRLAEEMGFKIATFQHVLEGYKVAKEIAAHGAGASTFADWWGYKEEVVDAIPYNAAIMVRKGVVVSINSDSAEHARRLNTEAAKTMKWGGLTEDEALALVTINPAKQLRIDHRVGSIEVGKDADVVIWTKHPLSSYATVERTYIDGIAYYDRQREERRLTELLKEKSALASTAGERGPSGEPPRTGAGGQGRAGDTPDGAGANGAGAAERTPPGPATAGRGAPVPQTGPVLAITNARIVPVTRPPIERGTVLVRGGRIAEVGADVPVPPGATVIDAAGGEVYPGWINARTTLGLAEPGPGGWYDDNAELLDYNPQLRTRIAYKADSDAIPVARANGVTAVAVYPSGGTLGGEVPVMHLDGWTWEEATVRPSVGLSFQFPSIGRGGGPGFGPAPEGPERSYEDLKRERDKKLDELADLFDRARAYAKAKAAGARQATDWVLEALVPVVEGRQPLITSVRTESDIKDAVAFAERTKVKIVVASGPEAALVAPLLKEKNIPVILGPVLTLPSREDAWHAASYQAAGELARAGVKFAFATGDTTNVRLLPYHAAMSVAWGLDRDEAIRALTIHAAEILGVADLMGSIEPGKLANLFIARGDPLEVRTVVTHVFVNGRDVGVEDRHSALYKKWMARP
jgi:imidazolonepropionase-like amidohydrolase